MIKKCFLIILILFTILGCDNQNWEPNLITELSSDEITNSLEKHYRDIFNSTSKSVVQINIFSQDSKGIPITKIGSGSGFMWDNQGHILTNYHVIENTLTSQSPIVIRTIDNDEFPAKVIGWDSYSDLAIIKISENSINDAINVLNPLELHDSDLINTGDITIAIGNPFDQEFTMTSGIVSAIGRSLDSTFTPYKIPSVIQTDAAINPGNSGGPLLNKEGQVIGINTQIKSSSRQNSGVSFAVPINLAKRVVPSIIAGDKHEYSYLGINALNLDYGTRIRADIEENFKGVLILNVQENGPAKKSGIRGDSSINRNVLNFDGDVITKINNYKINSFEDLISYLALYTDPGDMVEIELVRNYEYIIMEVDLKARPGN
ncbi:MAG: trypsin-like peptidase domain-containing protein [Dehalococcoidia bacterium]|nr:trypsin-like peptidase domain-containing protein [Dehalococcoidia bacterium]